MDFLYFFLIIQGVSEIGALILTGNRTHQRNNFSPCHFGEKGCVTA
jgi:hypothetical protein